MTRLARHIIDVARALFAAVCRVAAVFDPTRIEFLETKARLKILLPKVLAKPKPPRVHLKRVGGD